MSWEQSLIRIAGFSQMQPEREMRLGERFVRVDRSQTSAYLFGCEREATG